MAISWHKALDVEHKVQRILTKQEISGVNFDSDKAVNLIEAITEEQKSIYTTLRPHLKSRIEAKGVSIKKPFTVTGIYSKAVKDWYPNCHEEFNRFIEGPFTRIQYIEPDLGKREKLAEMLVQLGWQPILYTPTGSPILTVKGVPVDSLNEIEGEFGKLLGRWVLIEHRKNQIRGWLKKLRADKKLTAEATGSPTNTYRRKHKTVKNYRRSIN